MINYATLSLEVNVTPLNTWKPLTLFPLLMTKVLLVPFLLSKSQSLSLKKKEKKRLSYTIPFLHLDVALPVCGLGNSNTILLSNWGRDQCQER